MTVAFGDEFRYSVFMRFGLVFVPEEDVRLACEELSARLVNGARPRATLGAGALTHITLAHFETPLAPSELWSTLRAKLPATMVVDFQGLALLAYDRPYNAPHRDEVGVIGWLCVLLSEELRRAEREAVAALSMLEGTITTRNGRFYNPHVTLAVWDGSGDVAGALAHPLVSRTGVACRLSLGRVGENGVLESLFETAGEH